MMRATLLAGALVLFALLLTAVSGENKLWRNLEGNTCAVYYRFKRSMCDCADANSSDGKVSSVFTILITCQNTMLHTRTIDISIDYILPLQFNKEVEQCVLAQLGDPSTWGYALRTKWSMREIISLDALCED